MRSPAASAIEARAAKVQAKLDAALACVDADLAASGSAARRVQRVFVTFNEQEAMRRCLHSCSGAWLTRGLMPRSERFEGGHTFWARQASAGGGIEGRE